MSWRLTLDRNESEDLDRHKRVQVALPPEGDHASNYVASEPIIEALNTALSLGKPLLIAGEPGVGKTRLAHYAAYRLGLMSDGRPEVLRYDVRSTSKGADLVYRYDAIRHFRESQDSKAGFIATTERYIRLAALGQAIALACSPEDLPGNDAMQRLLKGFLDGAQHPRMSVVLIDEIDKAPRDVPNDLLRVLDEMAWEIDELGVGAELRSTSGVRPLVLITTNEERALPNAFLRRCCFLHIEFPKPEVLRDIVQKQLDRRWERGHACRRCDSTCRRIARRRVRLEEAADDCRTLELHPGVEGQGAVAGFSSRRCFGRT